jgi:hypothetical protein
MKGPFEPLMRKYCVAFALREANETPDYYSKQRYAASDAWEVSEKEADLLALQRCDKQMPPAAAGSCAKAMSVPPKVRYVSRSEPVKKSTSSSLLVHQSMQKMI